MWAKFDICCDGELYLHGMSLQDLTGLVHNSTADTSDVKFNIFDVDILYEN